MTSLYLQALADYLERLGEFGLPDAAGAGDSYLAYASWLRDRALILLAPVASGRAALAYAHYLGGDAADLRAAEALFRAGSLDPWYEGDRNTYSSTKETVNAVTWGHTFLWEWAAAGG